MLIADRFVSLAGRTIDLASGEPVLFQRLAAADRAQELAWSERCAALGRLDRSPGGTLIDYGLLSDGDRFEARRLGGGRRPRRALYADSAHVGNHEASDDVECDGTNDPVESLAQRLTDLFETASFGEPRRLRLLLPAGPEQERLLDVAARQARLSGFIPVSVDLLANADRHGSALAHDLREVVETRHLFLMARAPSACTGRGWCARRAGPVESCPIAVARLVLACGARSARPNVLLSLAGTRSPAPACLGSRPPSQPGRASSVRYVAARTGVLKPAVAAEAHERYELAGTSDLSRLHRRATQAVIEARGGRARRAEHDLRDVLGALVRRDDSAGAAWVALNLGCLLLDRGRALDAARAFEGARTYFDRGDDLPGAGLAAVYLGLAWTDEGRLSEAEAACRTARIAAQEVGLGDLVTEATLGLARCLYWQGRFDEATVLASSLVDRLELGSSTLAAEAACGVAYPSEAGERQASLVREAQAMESWGGEIRSLAWQRRQVTFVDLRVRTAALAARLALARGDVRAATGYGARALQAAAESARPVDACVAHTAVACVQGSLNDADGVVEHVRAGLSAARQARAPLRALRLRLLACDTLRLAGRNGEAARLLRRLASLDPARYPGLLRARLQLVVADGRSSIDGGGPVVHAGAPVLVAAACPWRSGPASLDMAEEIAEVLQVCHEIEDEEAALGRVCEAVRERMRAIAVGVLGRNGGAASLLARAGPGAGRSTIAERVLDTGVPVTAVATPLGLEAASPIRYAGAVIGTVACRWPTETPVDRHRAGCLLSAAAAATAPHVRTLLDRKESPAVEAETDETRIVGASETIETLRKATLRAAGAPFPVLVEGESGSGKELVARAIHRASSRRARRFCAINCAALTDDLLEAELFGHARGAFTGAVTERVGLFEEADGGTLFLDEVADLSPRAQAKLLRVLQDGEVRRIGENFARHVDARVIAATNRPLDAEVARGAFRRDLFYRLNVVHIDVPPLRGRADDIPVLAAHFWQHSTARIGSRATLAPATLATLARYDWPGNVRELQNVLAALAVSAPRRGSIGPTCLPAVVARAETATATLDEARRVFERRFVQAALAHTGGHRGRAAAALGISRQGLAKLMARLDLVSPDSPDKSTK